MGQPRTEEEHQEESSWYRQLGHIVKSSSSKDNEAQEHPEALSPARIGDVPQESRQCYAFEFADKMEQGFAPGVSSSFAEPVEDPDDEKRLRVKRSANHREYLLSTPAGEPLLLAVVSASGQRFDIYVARSGQPPSAFGPVFVLKAQSVERKSWTLQSMRCERCELRGRRACGVRELARMDHYRESVGDGQALAMDVDVPACRSADQGGCDVWCSICRGHQVEDEPSMASLTTVRPTWSQKHRTLTLNFNGRCTVASSKNFQLEVSEDNSEPGDVRLLFGKVGSDLFVLDYKRPFGMAQAFAAALTASHWV